jgi:hypothetical protein
MDIVEKARVGSTESNRSGSSRASSSRAQTIKLADLIDNTKTIVARDPKFAKVYLREKIALLHVLTKGDPTLMKIAVEQTEGKL